MRALLAALLAGVALAAAAGGPAGLPDKLELRYALRYGTATVGHVTKTLAREPDGSYLHRSRSVPEGMARWFTSVEWHEEGRFELVNGTVRPLRFLEYRVGADKPHRHEATFDWQTGVVHYAGWPDARLPAGTQDTGSLLYAFMLHPPAAGSRPDIHLSTGKKLRRYRYAQVGTETVRTALGELRTTVIERVPVEGKDEERFRVWLATDRGHLPVRIATEKRGQETVLEIESVR
jgi:hypothetical protein